jgi:hypothetical protein
MTFTRSRTVGTAFVVLVALVGFAAPVSAASTNMLGGGGNFEKPVLGGPGSTKTFNPGQSFGGWKVTTASVGLSAAFPGVMVPPQGNQALSLVPVNGSGGPPAGAVCRTISTLPGHSYAISFYGADVNSGRPSIVVQLGASSASVLLKPGSIPAVFKRFKVTLLAPVPNAVLCFTASNLTALSFPVIDEAKVVDLGPPPCACTMPDRGDS